MRIADFRLTRFQYARDRVIGDSQVRADQMHVATVELIADNGLVGLGFASQLFYPLPDLAELERVFRSEVWPGLKDQEPAGLIHRVSRPRGGNQRAFSLPFGESLQHALWESRRQAARPAAVEAARRHPQQGQGLCLGP